MPTAEEYYDDWLEEGAKHGAFTAVARKHGVDESTVRKAVRTYEATLNADPAIRDGMAATGLTRLPQGGWVKSHEKDAQGRTYSWYVKPEQAKVEDTAERVAAVMSSIPAIRLQQTKEEAGGFQKKAIVPINDLHAGSYAWGEETGST